jgi:hypothetical protein
MPENSPPPIGSKSRPYRLHSSIEWYRTQGDDHGLSFAPEKIQRATYRNYRLGIKQYRPADDNAPRLEIPPNAFVECFVIRKDIHDQSYHNMKQLGRPRETSEIQTPVVRSNGSIPIDFRHTHQISLYKTSRSEEYDEHARS